MIFKRLKEIRIYRKLSQEEVGSWFYMTKQGWGKNEKGLAKGLGLAEIELFLQKTQMMSRYLFEKDCTLEEADLTLEHKREGVPDLIQTIRDQENTIANLKAMIKDKEVDELSLRMSNNPLLRTIIERIFRWNDDLLEKADDLTKGLQAGFHVGQKQVTQKKRKTKSA